jgi:hypothetical protein
MNGRNVRLKCFLIDILGKFVGLQVRVLWVLGVELLVEVGTFHFLFFSEFEAKEQEKRSADRLQQLSRHKQLKWLRVPFKLNSNFNG